MARAIWKGSISFGLVNIPVGLYSAEKREELSFDLLEKKSKSRIRYKRVAEKSGREVPWEQIVRGYEYEDGRYVVLSDEDLKRANPEATQTVDILDFVELADISTVYFDKPYYLGPQKKGQKPYALLREVLLRSGKVGIAKVVIRTKQYLAAVVPQNEVLVLEILRFARELRATDELDLPGRNLKTLGITEREIEMGEKLVAGMAASWDPERYKDDYRKDLLKLIEKRVEAGELEGVEEAAPRPEPAAGGAKVVDLMALLKQSVEESGKGKRAAAPRGRAAGRKRMPARKAAPRRAASRRSAKKSA
ncbi:MAG TPA: Ku protein [Thermoanaerobaculia bacterium]|nr:Ku protein [Thermoanaerobaculia bacterium]